MLFLAAILGDAAFFALRVDPPAWCGAALMLAGGLAALSRRSLLVYQAGLACLLFGFGFGAAQLAAARAPGFVGMPSRAAQVTGRIAARDTVPDGARLDLLKAIIDGVPLGQGRHLRMHTEPDERLLPGATIALRGMVSPPSPPAYPGGRDLQRDAYFSRLAGSGYALGAVTVISPAPSGRLAAVRARIAERVHSVLPGPNGAVAATLLTGLSGAIPQSDRDAFRDSGLSHLLAIAGLHIGIVMGLALGLTRLLLSLSSRALLFWPVRQIAAIAALAGGIFYLLLTGLHVPTLRSVAMASLGVLAVLAGRRAISLRNWGIAALVVIAVQPEQVTGASFQLSFAAVLALIAGYQTLRPALIALRGNGSRARRALHHLATLGLTSLLAGTASLPFIAYHFGHIQLYYVASNLVAVPLAAFWIMPAGMIALATMPFGLDQPALWLMGQGVGLVIAVARHVAAWPAATVAVPHLPMAALLLMTAALAIACMARGRLRLASLVPLLAGCIVAAVATPPDILVSAHSRLAGFANHDALYLRTARGGDSYVRDQWMQHLNRPARPMEDAPSLRCTDTACTAITARGAHATFGDLTTPCDGTALIVVQSGAAPFCGQAARIDRATTFDNGSVAVWLGPPFRILTDRQLRGDRPWVFLPPEQERASIDLPMAPRE